MAGSSSSVSGPVESLWIGPNLLHCSLTRTRADILSSGLASALRTVGQVGQVATGFALAYDLLVTQDFQAALFDATDFGAYGGLAALGAASALESGGSSVFLSGFAMWKYHEAGGSKGLVQSFVCH